jgi:hypothetical protein
MRRFVKADRLSPSDIKTFSAAIGIAPGIVLGRLQHDGIIPYKTHLNSLKVFYRWKNADEE